MERGLSKKSNKRTLDRLVSAPSDKNEELIGLENYNLVLYGENHISKKDQEREIEIIKKFKPDYILDELPQLDSIPLKEEDYYGVTMNLENDFLNKITDKNLRSKTEDELNEIYSSMKKSLRKRRYINDFATFNDIIKRPLVELPPKYLKEVSKVLYEYTYKQNVAERAESNGGIPFNFRLALTNLSVSGDILNLKRPNKLLFYLNAYEANNDVNVIRIDLPVDQIEKGYYEKKFCRRNNELDKKREEEMSRNIDFFANGAKIRGEKIFVRVGDYHLRENSEISKYLDASGLQYKLFRSVGDDVSVINSLVYSVGLYMAIRENVKMYKSIEETMKMFKDIEEKIKNLKKQF